MESYIVRIHRRAEADPCRIVGLVEEVGTEGKKVFHTVEQLCCIFKEKSTRNTKRKRRVKPDLLRRLTY